MESKDWWLVPLIALGIVIVLVGAGISIGLCISIAKGHTVVSIPFWIIPAITFPVSGLIAINVFTRTVKIYRDNKNPGEWLIPIITILSGGVIEFCKEISGDDKFLKIFFGLIISVVFFAAGLMWKMKKIKYYFGGAILFISPPAFILLKYLTEKKESFLQALNGIPFGSWVAICVLLIIFFLVIMFSFLNKNNNYKKI